MEELNIEAWLDGQRVGHILCERHNERLQICDLWVEPMKRRQGIGTALLQRVLDSADATGVREICGDVTQDDIETCPGLLRWYERHGFVVREPDDQSIRTAAQKVVRRR